MATLTGPNEGIKYNWDLGTFYKTDLDDTLKLIDGTMNLSVIDKDLVAQPGGPTEGDRYIIPSGATGVDWAGQDSLKTSPGAISQASLLTLILILMISLLVMYLLIEG